MDLYMRNRDRAITVAGPAGRAGNNLAPENASPQPETPSNVAEAKIHAVPVNAQLQDLGVVIHATAVPHGMMPSVAFRVECGEQSIVFSGDVSGSTPALIELAKDCSMLVHDFAREYDGRIEVANDLETYELIQMR
jgi:ribonuclease BN (tRNA processing enzyme)